MGSIARGTLLNLVSRLAMVAMGLGITLVTARLGTQQQGVFALFTAVESILLTLLSGFGIALARRISHQGERPAGLVGAIVLACIGAGVVAAGVLMAVSLWGPADYSALWILAIAAPLLLVAPNLSGIWLGLGRMGVLAVLAIAGPGLTLLGVGLASAVQPSLDITQVLWSWVIAKMLVGLGMLVAIRRSGWLGRPDVGALTTQWRFVGAIGLTNLIGLMNYKIDLFLVQHFLGLSATGVYSVAVVVAELLWFVSSSVTQAAYSRIGTPDSAESARVVVRVVHISLLALLLSSPVLWLAASVLLPWLLGEAYRASLPALAVLLPGIMAFGAASALSAYFTNHLGRPLISAMLAGFSLLVNFGLSCALIPHLGILGGAIATSLSYGVSIVALFYMFARFSGTPAATLLRPDWRALSEDLRHLFLGRASRKLAP